MGVSEDPWLMVNKRMINRVDIKSPLPSLELWKLTRVLRTPKKLRWQRTLLIRKRKMKRVRTSWANMSTPKKKSSKEKVQKCLLKQLDLEDDDDDDDELPDFESKKPKKKSSKSSKENGVDGEKKKKKKGKPRKKKKKKKKKS